MFKAVSFRMTAICMDCARITNDHASFLAESETSYRKVGYSALSIAISEIRV